MICQRHRLRITKQPVVIVGLLRAYGIVIGDDKVHVGCESATVDEWLSKCLEDIYDVPERDRKDFDRYAETLAVIARAHQEKIQEQKQNED